jgi:hypothetical protein
VCDSPDYLTVHKAQLNVPDFLYYAGPTLHFIQEHKVGSDDNGRLETGEDGGISDCVNVSTRQMSFYCNPTKKKQYKIKEL